MLVKCPHARSIKNASLFSVSIPLSQIQRRTLLFLQQASYTPSFGGLGVRDVGDV